MPFTKLTVPFAAYSVQFHGEAETRVIEAQGCLYCPKENVYKFLVEDEDGDMCCYCILDAMLVASIIDPRFTKEATLAKLVAEDE